ncbi:hypothetical protein WJX77_011359 [Trebouxia sp. C0004]
MYMIPRSLRVTAHLKEEIVGVFGAQPPGGQNAALQPLPSALPPNDRWDRPREDQQYSIKRRGDRGDHQGRPICARIQHKCLARDGGNCSRSMAPGEAIRRPRYNSKDHQSSAGLACFVLHACVRLGARHHCFVLGVWRNFLDILDHCPHEYGGKRNIRYRDLASSCECLHDCLSCASAASHSLQVAFLLEGRNGALGACGPVNGPISLEDSCLSSSSLGKASRRYKNLNPWNKAYHADRVHSHRGSHPHAVSPNFLPSTLCAIALIITIFQSAKSDLTRDCGVHGTNADKAFGVFQSFVVMHFVYRNTFTP